MKYNPHKYQTYASEFIKNHDETAVFLDCGLGKTSITLTALNDLMSDELEFNKVLENTMSAFDLDVTKIYRTSVVNVLIKKKFLKTNAWKEKTKAKKELNKQLNGGLCEVCHKNKATTSHHLHYNKTWGYEDINTDLIAVCDECHSKIHNKGEK